MNTISTMSQDIAEQERFSTFKFGQAQGARPQSLPNRLASSHARRASSSSRSPTALNFTFPRSAGPLSSGFPSRSPSTSPIPLSTSPVPTSASPGPGSDLPPVTTGNKRHSHHRRQSSLSTRRESAEVMGVAPTALVEDPLNINLGDTDSIRRRALLALEGKSELGAFSAMELPTLGSPEIQAPAFSFPTSQTYPSANFTSFGSGMSSLVNKRDSFGKPMLPSASSKRQLGALIEEEEEEEEDDDDDDDTANETIHEAASVLTEEPAEADFNSSIFSLPAPADAQITPVPVHRPRPVALDLRLSAQTFGLPTPPLAAAAPGSSPVPSPSPRPGLRPLALAAVQTQAPTADVPLSRRLSLSALSSSSTASSFPPLRRPSLGLYNDQTVDSPLPNTEDGEKEKEKPKRPLSIAYKSGDTPPTVCATLPTPVMTPTQPQHVVRAPSPSGSESTGSGRMSLSEQHFLFKSHNALLARIEDLERALAAGRSSSSSGGSVYSTSSRPSSALAKRPLSFASSAADDEDAGHDDEMLRLVSDLKAERDELRSDVDGWRSRVADYEKQVSALARRLEQERREAWVARERAGLLEVEKNRLEEQARGWDAERLELAEMTRREVGIVRQAADEEIRELKQQLEVERFRAQALEEELAAATTPVRRRNPKFYSTDSELTEVGDVDESFEGTLPFKLGQIHGLSGLGAVLEEEEEEDSLKHYEDESFSSPGPFEDDNDEEEEDDSVETPVESPVAHVKKNSISSWTFPKVSAPVPVRPAESVDRFFECLEDYGNTEQRGKNMFVAMAGEEDEEDIPFFIPKDVGVEVAPILDTLVEQDEEEENVDEDDDAHLNDFGGVEVEGGIRFEFALPPPPPPPMASPPASRSFPSPSFGGFGVTEESEDEEDQFAFPQAKVDVFVTPPPAKLGRESTGPALPSPFARAASPSSPLARASSPKPSMIPVASPKNRLPSSPTTPISSSSSAPASFIPQPRSVSSPTTPTRFNTFKFGGAPKPSSSSRVSSSSKTSGTPPSLSTPRPAPKALVRDHRSCAHDDPCALAHTGLSCSSASRPSTPVSRHATPTPALKIDTTLASMSASTPATTTAASPSLWTLATNLAFGSRSATPVKMMLPAFAPKSPRQPPALVSRERQLARLRAEMAQPESSACSRCVGPVVHL